VTDLKNVYISHLETHKERKAKIEESEYNPIHREMMQGSSYLPLYFQRKTS